MILNYLVVAMCMLHQSPQPDKASTLRALSQARGEQDALPQPHAGEGIAAG